MNTNLILNSGHFCELVRAASENKHVKKIKLKAFGGSMSPFIKTGNLLTLKLIGNDYCIRIGDIVAVTEKDWNKIIIHRIIGKKNQQYQTKGDNNMFADEWFPKESIIGVITKIQLNSGKYYHTKQWQNVIIAFLSRTLILNSVMLPLVRHLKKRFTIFF